MWKIAKNGQDLGIIETNYAFALAYWTRRNCKLVPV